MVALSVGVSKMTILLPTLPSNVPQRGTPHSQRLFALALRLSGWRVTGDIPNIPKAIVIGAPHTSNYDEWLVLMTAFGLGLNLKVFAKHTVYRPPFRHVLSWLGVIPVHRQQAQGLTQSTIDAFAGHEQLWVGLSPEGTRTQASEWKSGFYHIATSAQVPIVLVGLDYAAREVRFLSTLTPSGNYTQDLALIQSYYAGITPAHPKRLSQPLQRLPKHQATE